MLLCQLGRVRYDPLISKNIFYSILKGTCSNKAKSKERLEALFIYASSAMTERNSRSTKLIKEAIEISKQSRIFNKLIKKELNFPFKLLFFMSNQNKYRLSGMDLEVVLLCKWRSHVPFFWDEKKQANIWFKRSLEVSSDNIFFRDSTIDACYFFKNHKWDNIYPWNFTQETFSIFIITSL